MRYFGSSVLAENYDETGIIMVRPLNLKNVLLSNDDLVRFPEKALGNNFPKFKHEDLLFARVGVPSCSIIPKAFECVTISPNIIAAELIENVDAYYIAAFLNTTFGLLQIERRFKAVSQPTVSTEEIKTLDIPLPDIKFQKYIGDKIRKAEYLRVEADQLIKTAENQFKELLEIKKDSSIYNNNAGNQSLSSIKKPVLLYVNENEINERLDAQSFHPEYFDTVKQVKDMRFPNIKLKDTLSYFDTGISSPTYSDKGFHIIMTKNLNNSFINMETKRVSEKEVPKDKLLNKNDVLLTTYGGPSIGKVDIWDIDKEATFDYTIMRLDFNEEFSPHFMLLLLRSKFVQNQIRYKIKGTTGITFVNPKDILEVSIPKIPKELQNLISEYITRSTECYYDSLKLIEDAKCIVGSLIEGTFDESEMAEM